MLIPVIALGVVYLDMIEQVSLDLTGMDQTQTMLTVTMEEVM
jgi:hypothetical protein